ncbi:MAG TPA: NAD(P)/FAD-dependent oxidoreductase [Gemmatimonadales bacterium]|nr:NAD(P)/FAD-dependent oxidoreductase [Gemmatimonadales bacterium]
MTEYDAVVIGAGVNGLVAGLTLARAGRRVLVLERSAGPGGQAAIHEFAPGYRTAPLGLGAEWVPPSITRALGIRLPEPIRPEWPIGVVTGPGDCLFLSRDPAAAARAIRRFSPADAGKWEPFCERLHKLAGFLAALYQLPPPDLGETRIRELLSLLGIARRLRGLGRVEIVELLRTIPMPVQELVEEWFEATPLKAAVGGIGVTGIRQGPRSVGTAFVLLHHQAGAPRGAIGRGGEAWWEGGPLALVDELTARCRSARVELRFEAEVARITVRDDRVAGVALASGEEITAPLVLSSADPVRTMLSLVDPVWLDPELRHSIGKIKLRGCTAVVSYALDELPGIRPDQSDGNRWTGAISLAGSLEELERGADAAKYGQVSERPFVAIRVPSARWPGFAPPGKHVLVAEVQWAPYHLRKGQWDDARREALGESVGRVIEEALPGFGRLVRAREVLTPPDLERRYGLSEGAPSHGELMLDQILFMRPVPALGRYATPLEGLYLCGAGSHPGPGVAGGPGWLAATAAVRQAGSLAV